MAVQQPTKPPAQPTYILRGHSEQIHAVHFLRHNSRLLTGDADGWVVLWSTTTKRSVGVWRAHKNTILGLGSWTDDRILTHGRDNKLHVWHLPLSDESHLSPILPMDTTDTTTPHPQPKLLHNLAVHALNFCAFASCPAPWPSPQPSNASNSNSNSITTAAPPKLASDNPPAPHPLLLATPGVQDGHVHVTSLPSETRTATIPTPSGTNTGMLMAVGLHVLSRTNPTAKPLASTNTEPPTSSTPQPSPQTSPAAATRSHPPEPTGELVVLAGYESGHVSVWRQESSPRLPSGRSAPLAWGSVYLSRAHAQPVLSLGVAGSRGVFFSAGADAVVARHPVAGEEAAGTGFAAVQTRHAGQQSLVVRSDERVFATAGWDGRVRVYDAAGLRELAVLKWHKEGCYAVAFAGVEDGVVGDKGAADGRDGSEDDIDNNNNNNKDGSESGGKEPERVAVARSSTVAHLRAQRAVSTHWIAAGSKDGKVSLWDIY